MLQLEASNLGQASGCIICIFSSLATWDPRFNPAFNESPMNVYFMSIRSRLKIPLSPVFTIGKAMKISTLEVYRKAQSRIKFQHQTLTSSLELSMAVQKNNRKFKIKLSFMFIPSSIRDRNVSSVADGTLNL